MGSRFPALREVQSKSRRPSSRWVSTVEFIDDSARSPAVETQVFSAAGMTAREIHLDSKAGFEYHWKGRSHYLALHDIQNVDSETFSDSKPVDRRHDLRGRMTFMAAGCGVWGWSVPAKTTQTFTALFLDPQQMEIDVANKLRNLPNAGDLYFMNAALGSTLEKLHRGLSADTRPDNMYLESLCLTAMLELCIYQQENIIGLNHAGRLAKAVEQKLADYVESHLGRDIGLDDLAKLAGLSRYHFVRAFKETTGRTPYHYLLERRIAMARGLLKDGSMSMKEIGIAVGFKDAARLSRAFRKITGISPTAYRES